MTHIVNSIITVRFCNDGYRIQPHIGLAIHDATNSDDIGPVKQKLKAMS